MNYSKLAVLLAIGVIVAVPVLVVQLGFGGMPLLRAAPAPSVPVGGGIQIPVAGVLPAEGGAAAAAQAQDAASALAAASNTPSDLRQTVAVRRGSISDSMPLTGRTSGADELVLRATGEGRVTALGVAQGQAVQSGQLLLQTDPATTTKQLRAARQRLDLALARLAMVNEQVQARRREDQRTADQQVLAARAQLQQSEAELARLTAGPDPAALIAGQNQVLDSRAQLALATAQYQQATAGPDPVSLADAQRDVQRAQAALSAVQATPADDRTRAAHDLAVADAQLNLQSAQARVAQLQAGDPAQAEAAWQAYTVAQQKAELAFAQYQLLGRGPDPSALAAATAAVGAQRQALASAEARQAEIAARIQADPGGEHDMDAMVDAKTVEQAQAEVTELAEALVATRLTSPIAGYVTQVLTRPGDPVSPGQALLTVAGAGDPIISASVTDDEAAMLSIGQRARVDLADGSAPSARLVGIRADGGGHNAVFQVDWGDAQRPAYGATLKLGVVLHEKTGVLLVPEQALHAAGTSRYVEYLDAGNNRRVAGVQVGIVSNGMAEIVGGLAEHQIILVANADDARTSAAGGDSTTDSQ